MSTVMSLSEWHRFACMSSSEEVGNSFGQNCFSSGAKLWRRLEVSSIMIVSLKNVVLGYGSNKAVFGVFADGQEKSSCLSPQFHSFIHRAYSASNRTPMKQELNNDLSL
ncbi:unnamed protein product [Chondrus crispus]|uniref:Uncharacterized protein n=1 Tax=Chondrus crispus TaxID=2769 RepID=R7QST2_CHOCR|nr:unnamed protein product [Chondrus crispus]CDF40803.1 unnamed protein product [Chondrus crispus]|eukprot:XP_005711097.1 unnamed protein product [Chondrus crispus]